MTTKTTRADPCCWFQNACHCHSKDGAVVHEEPHTRPSQTSQPTLPDSSLATQPVSFLHLKDFRSLTPSPPSACGSLHTSPGAQTSRGCPLHTNSHARPGPTATVAAKSHHTPFTPGDEVSGGATCGCSISVTRTGGNTVAHHPALPVHVVSHGHHTHLTSSTHPPHEKTTETTTLTPPPAPDLTLPPGVLLGAL